MRRGYIILAAFCGLLVSHGPVFGYTLGIFMKPISAEFGWLRGDISLMATVHSLTQAMLLPFAGRMIDKFGARKLVLIAMPAFALSIAALSLLPGQFLLWYLWFMVVAVFSTCNTPLPYAKVIIHWFDKKRGIALGISVAGVGVGGMLFPVFAQFLIQSFDWRLGYIGLGVAVCVIGLPIIYRFLHNEPPGSGLHPQGVQTTTGSKPQCKPAGLSVKQTLCTRTFWILALAIIMLAAALIGILIHLFPMLTDRGMSPEMAALAVGALGLSSTLGRILVGWLIDRFFAPRVAVIFFMGPIVACIIFLLGASGPASFLCAVLIGLSLGAEVDVIAFLTSRYFGTNHFTEIFGYLFSAFAIGAAIGPIVMGYGFDFTGNYQLSLLINVAMISVACVLFSFLGKYRYAALNQ